MNRIEAKMIIENEKLTGFDWNEDRYYNENDVGIKFADNIWLTYAADERASVITGSKKEFDSEEEALDDFICRLRADKVLRDIVC